MGEVWRGRDTVLARPVAVKLLKAEYADDSLFRRRFEVEAKNAASLHHPGIAGVFDFGEASPTDGGATPRPYLVMELVEGQPLSDLLRPGAPMDPDIVSDLMAQTADALGAAHKAGLVHRDVKPGNLIVTPDRRVKVTDFGIARAAEGLALTETGQVMGTPAYISPEQAEGSTATAASDVYSLGVVAFECLAGRRPFTADTPVATAVAHLRQPVPTLPDAVPADLAAVVTRALAKDPGERYPDGSAFAAALRSPSTAAAAGVGGAAGGVAAATSPPHSPATTQVLPATPAGGATGVVPPPVTQPQTPPPPAATAADRRTPSAAWLPWVLLAAVLVVGALIIWQLTADDDEPTDAGSPAPTTRTQTESPTKTTQTPSETASEPSTTPTTTSEPPEETVTVEPGAYVGRDHKDVSKELEDLGLEVSEEELENPGDQPEGAVASVEPSGKVPVGETVVVTYYGKVPGGQGNGNEGNGNEGND
ncbi:serine/threonine protein kinase [Nocardioides piscis]|uniref:non-specific serine/threonine protein kinase n=1 Tax=Nocardioides piscis TaxID=2714938 RepID=A0A6G7YDU7_9ACTN|nr:serine/threonine protein kinase [Nocardioides piscis]QIK74899.1 serine/threonine protein kinase [Nocardioides piscis]